MKESSSPFPTVMYNIDGSNIVKFKFTQGQISVSFNLEPNWEALAFTKDYSTGRNHFAEEREIPITVSKYVHARYNCKCMQNMLR